jgi:ABC-type branched-subunit amino acid transport system substrate-binding protein
MIGPDFSSGVAASLGAIRQHALLTISPSSTAPELAAADDGGYLFRDVPNDEFQGIAAAYYLLEVVQPPASEVAVVYHDDAYGRGLKDAFQADFLGRGGVVLGSPIAFQPGLDSIAEVEAVWDEIAALAPEMVVLITFAGDAMELIQRWDDGGTLPDLEWFFTDGVKTTAFANSRPNALESMRGTAPTHSHGVVFDEFQSAFVAAYDEDVDQEAFLANNYDSVHLLALALARQAAEWPPQPLGGERLRDALTAVATKPGTLVRASEYAQAVRLLEEGQDVDYDGASGPCDFDERGEAIGPYEIWRIVVSGGQAAYEQEQYLEPTDLLPAGM